MFYLSQITFLFLINVILICLNFNYSISSSNDFSCSVIWETIDCFPLKAVTFPPKMLATRADHAAQLDDPFPTQSKGRRFCMEIITNALNMLITRSIKMFLL